jgi:hypothetical protein
MDGERMSGPAARFSIIAARATLEKRARRRFASSVGSAAARGSRFRLRRSAFLSMASTRGRRNRARGLLSLRDDWRAGRRRLPPGHGRGALENMRQREARAASRRLLVRLERNRC